MTEDLRRYAEPGFAALRRYDLDAFLEYVDPGVEWHSLVLEVEGVYHGHEGVRTWWRNLQQAFPHWQPEVAGVQQIDESLVVHVRVKGSGGGSGLPLDEEFWQVATMRDGKIVRYRGFRTENEAIRAARSS